MKMRKVMVMAAVMGMTMALTACGQKEEVIAPETEVSAEAEAEETVEEETEEVVTEEPAAEESVEEEPATEEPAVEEPVAEESAEDTQTAGYEDNFAVNAEAAAEFAGKIQAAVAAKDLEALAELTSYPTYIGFTDGSVTVASKEELLELGAERIFTPELMESVAGADVGALEPSMAGFSVSKDGKPNIIFGVTDGALGIKGMNY